MNTIISKLVLVTLLSASSLALASPVTFTYYNQSAANESATFTVDVNNGLASDGAGTFSIYSQNYNLTLLSANSVLPGGYGNINPTPGTPSYDLGSGFTWQGVPGSGGANIQGDTVVNPQPNYLDDYGLIFLVTNQSTNAIVGGLNIWTNNNTPSSLYATNQTINGSNIFENTGNGTLTIVPVPEPDRWVQFLVGLGLVGFAVFRRRSGQSSSRIRD